MADDDTKAKADAKEAKTEKPPVEKKEEKVDVKSETKTDATDTTGAVDEKAKDVAKDEIVPELTNEYKLPAAGDNKPMSHKSIKKVLIGALIVFVMAILAAGAVWMTHDDPVSQSDSEIVYSQGAAVTAVEGDVEYNTGDGWNTVDSGTNLEEGASLRTMTGSRAIITLDEGSAIRLDSDTVVTITKLTVDEVIVDNAEGQVYARVVPSEKRVFVVKVDEQDYQAVGTAYMTVNQDDEKGVEVYHSKVDVKDKSEVAEGETYFTESKDGAKKEKVAKLDLEKLKDDDFVNWNKSKDEGNSEYADKLGVLKDLGKEEAEEEETPDTTPGVPAGITLSGSKGTKGINVSWSVNGINTADGFKVVFDKSDTTPTYGENSAQYVSPGNSSTLLDLTSGKTWNIRVCAYRADAGSCDSYSNAIQVTAPVVEKEIVKLGGITLSENAGKLTWTLDGGGNAPYGFKVVYNIDGNGSPQYPGDNPTYVNTTQYQIPGSLPAGTYRFAVCKYNENTSNNPAKCLDYSNEIVYVQS